jgi:hypothetical protein
MADSVKKFLFMADAGFAQEQSTTPGSANYINLSGLTVGSGTYAAGKITGLSDGTADGDSLAFGQAGANFQNVIIDGASGLNMSNQPIAAAGSLAMYASGTGIDMNGTKVTELGTPTAAGDATTKSYVDTLVTMGVTWREIVLSSNQLTNAAGIKSASALTMASNPASGDTIVLTNGTNTRTYGAGTGGDVQYAIGGTIAITMQNLATAIAGDVHADAAWTSTFFLTTLAGIDADGVVLIMEDSSASALSKVYGTWATPANCKIVDYTSATDYISGTLVNMPAAAPTNANFGFHRAAASCNPGELHQTRAEDTLYAWDQDTSAWVAVSGASSIPDATSASGGGVKGKVTFNSDFGLQVNSGVAKILLASNPGMSVSSSGLTALLKTDAGVGKDANGLYVVGNTSAGISVGASGVGVSLYSTNPGLSFDVGGGLQVKYDGSHGVITGASGLEVEIEASKGLAVGASGLAVVLEAAGAGTGGLAFNGSSGIRIDIADSTPGLQLTNTGIDTKLVAAASNAGGLEAVAGGLQVKTDAAHGIILTATGVEAEVATATGLEVLATGIAVNFETTNPTLWANGSSELGVKLNAAGAIVTSATGLKVQLEAATPTLQIDGSNQLGVKVVAANTGVGGLETSAAGLQIKTDGSHGLTLTSTGIEIEIASSDQLSVSSSGLAVVGVPTQFKIGTSAVSANVTAANLGTLTAGSTSNADTLHTHDFGQFSLTYGASLIPGDPVYVSAADTVLKARADTDANARVLGLAVDTASSGSHPVMTNGKLENVLISATPGAWYYLAPTGGLTATIPGSGNRVVLVGQAVNTTDLAVRVQDFGKKA